jgi:hypothetical protein
MLRRAFAAWRLARPRLTEQSDEQRRKDTWEQGRAASDEENIGFPSLRCDCHVNRAGEYARLDGTASWRRIEILETT